MAERRLIYWSTPCLAQGAGADGLEALVGAFRRAALENNGVRGLSGALAYGPGRDAASPGFFMQALEGDMRAVGELSAVIARDPRHRDLTILSDKPISNRVFADSNMAFASLTGPPAFVDMSERMMLSFLVDAVQRCNGDRALPQGGVLNR